MSQSGAKRSAYHGHSSESPRHNRELIRKWLLHVLTKFQRLKTFGNDDDAINLTD